MRAFSVRQPWASLIVSGEKRVESARAEAPPFELPARVAVHASRTPAPGSLEALQALGRRGWAGFGGEDGAGQRLAFGAIIGTVEIVKAARIVPELVARLSPLERALGAYEGGGFAWALRAPTRLRRPLPLGGALGFFELSADVSAALVRGVAGEAGLCELVCARCGGALDGAHAGGGCPRECEAAREAFEERAAIREFDGGFPRAEAERLAREDMAKDGAVSGAAEAPGESGRGVSAPRESAAPGLVGPVMRPSWAGPNEAVPCRSCGAPIWWRKTESGKRAPFDSGGVSHFATCPNAAEHRRPRERKGAAGEA